MAGQAGTGRGVDGGVGGGWGGSEKKSICLDFVLLKKKKLVWSVFLLSTWVFIASGKVKMFP